MNPDELANSMRAKGYQLDARGQWYKPARAVLHSGNSGKAPKLERDSRDGTLGQKPVQVPATRRFFIRLTAVRHRLLDEDNACEKYHVDCCRYAGLIPGDGPATTKIETRQENAEPGGPEFVRVEIFRL